MGAGQGGLLGQRRGCLAVLLGFSPGTGDICSPVILLVGPVLALQDA